MESLLEALRAELRAAGDPRNVEGARRFFKEPIDSYGLRMADTRALARACAPDLRRLDKAAVFALCEELWRSGKMEEGHIAALWAYGRRREFAEADLPLFEGWMERYVSNWAACDHLGNAVLGALFEKFPALVPVTERWAAASNRWVRRSAAVSLIVPARKGRFLEESLRVATLLLTDADDLVQKGYGWLLKEQCKKHEAAVFAFVDAHKHQMPRTALRYAIEKMPPAARSILMERK